MAFVYELVRLKRRDLYLFGHSPGGDWDILIGAGCVKRVELAYEADEAFNTVGPRWRQAVERGEIEWEDYSNFSMVARFTAGAMGIPFMPIRSLLGSDVLRKASPGPSSARLTPHLAQKLHVMDSPFDARETGSSWCRPSTPISPCCMSRRPRPTARCASKGRPLPMCSRPCAPTP